MARFASPALGCQLSLVEVEIGTAKETYDPEHFSEPLELSLEGQRSLGSDCGILSLLITAGTRQMLSIRLNDLLSHPNGTEGIICVDKGKHELCVRLPNWDHILRVWFVEERDFLISVCILRKSGFKINEGKTVQRKATATTDSSNRPQPTETSVGQTAPFSSTTPLTMLTAQAKSLCNDQPSPFSTREHWGKNIFDEVLESLQRLNEDSKSRNAVRGDLSLKNLGSPDLSYLNPYNAFLTKNKVDLGQPIVGSPLKNIVNQEQRRQRETGRLKATCTVSKPTLRHRHRYFTRSFSSKSEKLQNTRLNSPSSSLKVQRNASVAVGEVDGASTPNPFSASFDSSPAASLEQLIPRRRKLPFSTNTKRTHKNSRHTSESTRGGPRRESITPPMAHGKTQLDNPRRDSSETTIILTNSTSLDKLDEVSHKIFDQYEKDVARGCDQDQCAVFYWERLHSIRSGFWLNELMRIGSSSDRGTRKTLKM